MLSQAALPEFQQKDSRDYFVFGHQLPPYEKSSWKNDLDMVRTRILSLCPPCLCNPSREA